MKFENYYLYRIAAWLSVRLPLRLVYLVAAILAEFNFLIDKRSRDGIYANQRRVLPPETSGLQRWRLARRAFRHFAYSAADFFRMAAMNPANLHRFVPEVSGWEHLTAAQEAGKGGILVTVHMGSWELGGAYLGLRGIPLTAAALPHKDPRIDRIFLASREARNIEIVPVGGALRKLRTALTRGRFIALASDRDVSGRGPRLPFFGAPTHVPDGHAKLALATGAWILPACVVRCKNRSSKIEIRPPIIPDPASDTVETLTLRCLTVLEDFIRTRPEQWLSFYNLWNEAELPVA